MLDKNSESLSDYTIALLWWVNSFWWDYIKYAEALFSNEKDEKIKSEKIKDFLMNSKEYYLQLQHRVNSDTDNIWIPYISYNISNMIAKIVQNSVIK